MKYNSVIHPHWTSPRILGAKPLIADTGNGFHLLWMLASPVVPDQEALATYKECLLAIQQRFGKGNVEIDTSVAEPEQLARLYGTWNRRAPETEGRPWRQSRVLAAPSGKVLPSALDLLACQYSGPRQKVSAPLEFTEERTRPEWREHYGIAHLCEWGGELTPLIDTYIKDGGIRHYMINNCMFETEDGLHKHSGTERKTELLEYPDGGIGFNCLGSDDWFREQFKGEDKPTFRHFLKRLNQLKGENYPHLIFPEEPLEKLLEGFVDPEQLRMTDPAPTGLKSGEIELFRGAREDGQTLVMSARRASDIEPEEWEWLWEGRIPRGCIALVAGRPGNGKSMVALDLASRISSGRDFPNGSKNTMGSKDVLYAPSCKFCAVGLS